MKTYWLTLRPHTFVWAKGDNGIVYNSENYQSYIFANIGQVNKLYLELMQMDNLYCVSIDEESMKSQDLRNFVEQIVGIDAGCLVEKESDIPKPISYMPILKVQENIESLRSRHRSNKPTNDIFKNLSTLTLRSI